MTRQNTSHNHRKALPISAKQRTVIMIICTQFGISKAERGAMLQERYGKSSTADLSSDQAGHFIQEFEKKGFVLKSTTPSAPSLKGRRGDSSSPPVLGGAGGGTVPGGRPAIPRSGNVIALATRDELEKVDQLARLIPWREENGLELFLFKRMGIKDGRIRTGHDAYMAIEGLKKMFANGMKKTYGAAWWLKVYTNPDINEFIRRHKPEEWK